jgi:hypothetical protein
MLEMIQINETQFQVPIGFDGDVEICRQGETMLVPFADLKALVACYARWVKMSQLDELDDDAVLGTKW